MPNVGYATIQIIPSVRGISDELRRQLVGPAGDAGDAAGQESGGRFSDKWKAGLAAAGAAAGAVLVAATVSAVEKERMADRLSAQLGLSGKGAKQAGKVAGDLYSKAVVDSFEDGAAAVRAVMGSGLIPEKATTKSIEAITTKVADLASTFDQDLSGTASAAAQMIRTGLAKDGAQALDLLTKGFQSSANKADDFVDTINEYGTQFRKAGLDGATAIGLLNQAIRGGARDADIAADAIKEFSIRAVDGSTSSAQGFNDLGLSGVKMAKDFAAGGASANAVLDITLDRLRAVEDPVKQSRIAVALFGTQAEDLGKALFAMDPSSAAAGLGQVGGAAKNVGDTIRGNTSTELKVLQRQLTGALGVLVTSVVIPALNGLIAGIQWLGDVVQAVVGWLREWGIWLAPLGILIAGITLTLSAQAIVVGTVTAVFAAYRAVILAWMAVQRGAILVQAALNAVMSANPIGLVITALVALAAAVYIAWQRSETFRNIVMGAWHGIQTAALWAWNHVLKPVFDALVIAVKAVGAGASWLWNSVLSPVFGWIGDKATWLWENALKPAFSEAKKTFEAIGTAVKWVWNNILSPVFTWIGDKGKWLWDNALKPAFDNIKSGIDKVGKSFEDAKNFISGAWTKVQDIAKKPVKFLINTIYNGGIVPTWNKIATAFGANPLKKMILPPGFATGGVLPGYTPGRDVHMAALSGGEAIMRPEWTRAVGPGYVHAMNAAARRGGIGGVQRALGIPGYADGGIFGWIGKTASKGLDLAKAGVSWLKDGLKASAMAGMNSIVRPLIEKISGSSSLYRQMITGIPKRMLEVIFNYSGRADGKLEAAGVGGKGYKGALSWARTQNGKPYQWGGNGNPSWDCSGFMSAIESAIRGQKPHRRWSTHAFQGGAPPGWVRGRRSPFMVGITHAGVGHTAGTLNGVKVESRGGDGVVVGSRARGHSDRLFSSWYGFVPAKKYDGGGWLQPGVTAAVNATGQPEAILTARQWQVAQTAVSQAVSGFTAGQPVTLVVQDGPTLRAYVDDRADGRVQATLQPAVTAMRANRRG